MPLSRRFCGLARFGQPPVPLVIALVAVAHLASALELAARDYILTVGGGYRPASNQASLEANVVFFQQVLNDKVHRNPVHEIFFADGFDPGEDLQYVDTSPRPVLPASELLARLYRRDGTPVEYRNHQVPRISGANDPEEVRECLAQFAKRVQSGDRLIVYVTAHGGSGDRRDPYNTSISCWDDKSITVREFNSWLSELPRDVPVVLVMAQCYCGGFAHAIFNGADSSRGLAEQLRIGFFAQQHNLPAAGCRPDVGNDEEFSSYFWGAMVGRRRTGEPMSGCDADGDGIVSFSEAYVHTLVASDTIDIPLKASDVLLRTYSRIPGYRLIESRPRRGRGRRNMRSSEGEESTEAAAADSAEENTEPDGPKLHTLSGPIEWLLAAQSAATRRAVTELAGQLGISLGDDVESVLEAYRDHQDQLRSAFRGRWGRRGSGRRELLREIAEKWPELANRRTWHESPLLNEENQAALAAEIEQLASYQEYSQRQAERERLAEEAALAEFRDVKFQRLIRTLEVIVLSKNLPLVATPEVFDRYAQMISMEETALN